MFVVRIKRCINVRFYLENLFIKSKVLRFVRYSDSGKEITNVIERILITILYFGKVYFPKITIQDDYIYPIYETSYYSG
jgi:hypothetical protein